MTTADMPAQKPSKFKQFLFGRPVKPYVHPYLGGTLLGIVLFLAFFLTGNGLGASGGMNRIVVFFEDLIAPAHIDQVAYLLKMAGGVEESAGRLDHSCCHWRPAWGLCVRVV